ncbi:MAG: hypothetical protein HY898_00285 [Deltaproteobacteria bacterium]|nr:hypothetical protein [Deltaproteobacteria bacterium]
MRVTARLLVLCCIPVACSSSGVTETPVGVGTGGNLDCTSTGAQPDPDAVARAAVVVGSCVPDDRPTSYASHFYDTWLNPDRNGLCLRNAISCLATHGGGCKAVADCLATEVDLLGPCERACEGNVAVACDDELRFRSDCGRLGQSCVSGRCVEASSGAPACTSQSFEDRCDNGAPVGCSGGFEKKGPVCADHQGLVCGDSGFGEKACVGSGAACQQTVGNSYEVVVEDGLACIGNSLDACTNGKRHTFDCNGLVPGFSCQAVAGATPPAFCGLASECSPKQGKWKETCEGDMVVMCNAGRTQKVDCKSLGFSGCQASRGVCVPSPWGN